MKVNYKPEGYHTITPYFIVSDARVFIDFITVAFDAEKKDVHEMPDGTIMHAEFMIGDSHLMIGSASNEYKPNNLMLHLYVEDVDSVFKKAVEAGCESLREPRDEFYGDRSGGLKDKFGNTWWLATHVEDVSKEEMERRMKEQQ